MIGKVVRSEAWEGRGWLTGRGGGGRGMPECHRQDSGTGSPGHPLFDGRWRAEEEGERRNTRERDREIEWL